MASSEREDDVAPPRVLSAPGSRRPARSRLWWATRPGVGVKAGVVLLAVGLVLTAWALLRPPPGVVHRPPAPTPVATGQAQASTDPAAAGGQMLVVHVAGAVAAPGLVTLEAGARIADAIGAAGGPAPDAVLDAVNLAAPAVDGEQIYVPIEAESPAPAAAAAEENGAPGGPAAPVDLNTADAAELETLPGIGPVTAEKILSWRTEHGPFADVSDLLAVPGIGPATLAQLEERVRV